MVRFYISPDKITGDTLKITDENFHYLRNVLRVRKGEELKAFDGKGKEYLCQVIKIHPRHIVLNIKEIFDADTEASVEICLAQGLIKAKHFEFAIQKCTELGVKKFIPVVTERTVVRLRNERAENRRLRWEKIAVEAAKQCGRSFYPEVEPVTSFGDALKIAQTRDMSIIPWEEEQSVGLRKVVDQFRDTYPRSSLPLQARVMVFIGPEGGFSSQEVSLAKKSGVTPVSLGPRLLRSETASIATAAILIHELNKQIFCS